MPIQAGKNIQLIRFCGLVNFRRIKARKEEEILIKFKKKQKQEENKDKNQKKGENRGFISDDQDCVISDDQDCVISDDRSHHP